MAHHARRARITTTRSPAPRLTTRRRAIATVSTAGRPPSSGPASRSAAVASICRSPIRLRNGLRRLRRQRLVRRRHLRSARNGAGRRDAEWPAAFCAVRSRGATSSTAPLRELTRAGKPAKCMWCHESGLMMSLIDYPAVERLLRPGRDFDALIAAAARVAELVSRRLDTQIDYRNRQDHTFAELLYLSFEEPSRQRLAREWGVPRNARPSCCAQADPCARGIRVPRQRALSPRGRREARAVRGDRRAAQRPRTFRARVQSCRGPAVNAPLDVSVVMPTWNRAQFLRESIESVLAQTVPIRGTDHRGRWFR